ncbi:tryptophanyl-tRNA synthetase [Phycomyces blakesleeanus]|uniref:tryptophan--tRNA ligase n=1 Tax=Phycomyces blakesleeanus TaxID=4837 RepID=A0ABR3AP29_PHYBL
MLKNSLSTASKSRIIFSGIQPTGQPHLGNYLGALDNWVKLQPSNEDSESKTYYSIVDLHAITMPQNPAQLREGKLNMAMTLLACGVDPKRSILFEQSRVRAHSELAWIFNCITPVGWLGRMTQWKTKMDSSKSKGLHAQNLADESQTVGLRMGLFDYPVLQAADILLYKATHVPIGEDQIQHLELARDIGTAFNTTFKPTFPLPEAIIPPTKRVMSLREPMAKMSKSDPSDLSRINLTDSPEAIQSKVGRATTDGVRGISYDPKERPGVSNLLGMYAAMRGLEMDDAVKAFENVTSTKEFKEEVAASIVERLAPIQNELKHLQQDVGYVHHILGEGARKANEVANHNMEEVYKVVGLR